MFLFPQVVGGALQPDLFFQDWLLSRARSSNRLEKREDTQGLALGQHNQALATRQVGYLKTDRRLARVLHQHFRLADPAGMLQHKLPTAFMRPVN